jgi:hypothetical protein
VNIHNQCSGFKLTYLGHFESDGYRIWDFAQEIDASSMESVDLLSLPAVFKGALVYKLERRHAESDIRLELMHIQL